MHYIKRIIILAAICITPLAAMMSISSPVHAANLALSPAEGPPGSTTVVSGNDFTGKLATIYWDSRIIAREIAIAENGSFSHEIEIPNDYKGLHSVRVVDDSNWAANDVESGFTVTPSISCQPSIAREWTPITVTGKGFQKQEEDITLTIDGQPLPLSPISAGPDGVWTAEYTVPAEYAGMHVLSAYGSTTSADELGNIDLIVSPWMTLEPRSGAVGSQMIIQAWGFRHNEDGISLAWDDDIFFMNIRAEADGSILLDGTPYPHGAAMHDGKYRPTILVPESTSGIHTLVLYGSSFTPKGTFPEYEFEVVPNLKNDPAQGRAGTRIQVTGTGFAAGEAVTLKWDNETLDTALRADSKGSFSTIVTAPQSSGSSHTISASGEKNHSAQAYFSLEEATKVQISLVTPAQDTSYTLFNSVGSVIAGSFRYLTGIFSYLHGNPVDYPRSPKITFRWSGGGLQGATYILQIAEDGNFSSTVLEKEIRNDDTYTLGPSEMLSEGKYAWRVMTIDSRGIESPWSEASVIEIVSMPTRVVVLSWVAAVLVLAAIICGLLFLWYYLRR